MNHKFQIISGSEKIRVPFDFMKSYISLYGYRIMVILDDACLDKIIKFKIWKIAKLMGETVIYMNYILNTDTKKIEIGGTELPIDLTEDGYTTMKGITALLSWMEDNKILIDSGSILNKIDQVDNTLKYHSWTIKFDKISQRSVFKPIIYMFDWQYTCIISNDVNQVQINNDKDSHIILIPGYGESTKFSISDLTSLFSWLDDLYIQIELLKLEKSITCAIITSPTDNISFSHGINHMKSEICKWDDNILMIEENNKKLRLDREELLKKVECLNIKEADNNRDISKYKTLKSDYENIIASVSLKV